MANRDPERRHAVRGAGGRWGPRQSPAAGQLGIPEPATEPATEPPPEPARDARDARPAAGGFRLNIRTEDVTPAAPGAIPSPAGPAFDVDPAVDVPFARMLAEGVNTLVDMAGLPAANSAEVARVGDHAAPVLRRAGNRLGLGDAVAGTVPEWVVEVGNLTVAVGVAWGPAGVILARAAIERRRSTENPDDDPNRASGYGSGGASAPDPIHAPAPRGATRAGAAVGEGGQNGAARPGNDGPVQPDELGSAFGLPGIR